MPTLRDILTRFQHERRAAQMLSGSPVYLDFFSRRFNLDAVVDPAVLGALFKSFK